MIRAHLREVCELLRGDFSAKVRLRMRFDRNPLFVTVQDKYRVKTYAAAKGIPIAKLLYVTDRPETIPFDELPGNYFIKANHGCGWNIRCLNGALYTYKHGNDLVRPDGSFIPEPQRIHRGLSKAACVELCRGWLNRPFSLEEWAYRHIDRRILVEEVLMPREGQSEMKDYRFFVFDGRVRVIGIGSPTIRRNNDDIFFYPDWQPVPLTVNKDRMTAHHLSRPQYLSEMIRVAECLSEASDFFRIDLYETTRGVVLGEMTVYPQAGQIGTPSACPSFNRWLGNQWRFPYTRVLLRSLKDLASKCRGLVLALASYEPSFFCF